MIYELTDHEWNHIEKYLPKSKSGRKPKDLRRTLSGIKWILKNGGSWRSLPEYFGNWNSVYRYFCRLQEKQVFENIFMELTKEADLQDVSIDSSFVSVNRSALGAKKTTSSRPIINTSG